MRKLKRKLILIQDCKIFIKASQKKYAQSEKGKAKISEIKKRHYEKCKAENPDFLRQQAEKVKRNLLARKAKKEAEAELQEK